MPPARQFVSQSGRIRGEGLAQSGVVRTPACCLVYFTETLVLVGCGGGLGKCGQEGISLAPEKP